MIKVYLDEYKFASFKKILNVQQKEWSVSVTLAFALLKSLARCKPFKRLMKKFYVKLKEFIEKCIEFSPNNREIISGFFNVLKWMKNTDLSEIHEYLERFDNQDYVNQLLVTGNVAFYYLLQGQDPVSIFNNEPSKVFKEAAEALKIYFKIWKGTDFLIFGPSEKQEGPIVNVFEYENQFFWLVGEQDDSLERGKILNEALYQESFFFNSESIFSQDSSHSSMFSNADVLNTHPKMAEFIKTMAAVMVNDKLYSKDIRDQLELAVNEVDSLMRIKEIKDLMNLTPLFCEIHQNSVFISLFCRKQHCRICVYEIIKKKFSRDNFVIYCSCGIQIPPKNIHEIKKEHDYKEFSRRFSLA